MRIIFLATIFVALLFFTVGIPQWRIIGAQQCNPAPWLDEDTYAKGPFGNEDVIIEVYTTDGEWLNVAPVLTTEAQVYTLCAERSARVLLIGWKLPPFRRTIVAVRPVEANLL